MMEQSLVGEVMKTQDLPYVVTSVSKNPKAYKHAWDFLQANWDSLIKKWDTGLIRHTIVVYCEPFYDFKHLFIGLILAHTP